MVPVVIELLIMTLVQDIADKIIYHMREHGNLEIQKKYEFEDPKVLELVVKHSYNFVNELETRNKYSIDNSNFDYYITYPKCDEPQHQAVIIYGMILDNLPSKWFDVYTFKMAQIMY